MKKFISLFLSTILAFSLMSTGVFAKEISSDEEILNKTAAFLLETIPNPSVNSTGGDWSVFALARSNFEVPEEYFNNYYQNVENFLKENNGVLSTRKYSEYSRVVLALSAIGRDVTNVAGYNLLLPLADYEKVTFQGLNGAIFALLALDCMDYQLPFNEEATTQGSRELYVEKILSSELESGGWSLSGSTLDPDITGMAIQALVPYKTQEKVSNSIEKAINALSSAQKNDGGFESFGVSNVESTLQVIIALNALNIPLSDGRFVKNGCNLYDNLITFILDNGSFCHFYGEKTNILSTEQSLYALASIYRSENNMLSLYDMRDVKKTNFGLENKNENISYKPVVGEVNFDDISLDDNKEEILSLASRQIINGKSVGVFDPTASMTRAEFATISVKALGLPLVEKDIFEDVNKGTWYYSYVATAFSYGIIKGQSEKIFNPEGTITREEAAVMVARSAALCGMNTSFSNEETTAILSRFSDSRNCATWSASSFAFCYDNNILDGNSREILPQKIITRSEIAKMLYNLMEKADLI